MLDGTGLASASTGPDPDDLVDLGPLSPLPVVEAALRIRGLKRAALALRTVAVKRSMACPRPGTPAASAQGDLTSISAVSAALAVAAAQPVDMVMTDWLRQIMHLLREAQARSGRGEDGMGALQELFMRLLTNLDAGGGGSGP